MKNLTFFLSFSVAPEQRRTTAQRTRQAAPVTRAHSSAAERRRTLRGQRGKRKGFFFSHFFFSFFFFALQFATRPAGKANSVYHKSEKPGRINPTSRSSSGPTAPCSRASHTLRILRTPSPRPIVRSQPSRPLVRASKNWYRINSHRDCSKQTLPPLTTMPMGGSAIS